MLLSDFMATKGGLSLDVIEVQGHFKKGVWITPHVHLNVTYLFEASDKDFIKENLEENSSVKWLDISKLDTLVNEENMKVIYKKIIDRIPS